jgi:preprotein translocase subunit SecG
MTGMLLAAWYHTIFGVLFAFLCVLLIGVILLQRGRGGGLSGAFGGMGGAASTAFGSKTGDILTWITVAMAVLFLLFAVGLNYMFRPSEDVDLGLPTIQQQAPPVGTPQSGSSGGTTTPAATPPATPPDSSGIPTESSEPEGAWLKMELPPLAGAMIFGADAA